MNARTRSRNPDTSFFRSLVLMAFLVPFLAAGVAALPAPALAEDDEPEPKTCLDDRTGRDNVCAAKDVNLASVRILEIHDGCEGPGDTARLSVAVEYASVASTRYDVGVFLAADGGDARHGACHHAWLPGPLVEAPDHRTSSGKGPYLDEEPKDREDVCGDIRAEDEPTRQDLDAFFGREGAVEVACVDRNDDGRVDVSWCTFWDNNHQDTCRGAEDAVPGTVAKCRCGVVDLDLAARAGTSELKQAPVQAAVRCEDGKGKAEFDLSVSTSCATLVIEAAESSAAGELDGRGSCAFPQRLGRDGSYSCRYPATVRDGKENRLRLEASCDGIDVKLEAVSVVRCEEQEPEPECEVDADCSDGLFCSGAERCKEGACVAAAPIGCDDGLACTVDACDEESDSCVSTPDDGACDDGRFCNGPETCDPASGCATGQAPACDDGIDCTVDACDAATDACLSTPDDTACDDGLFCTGVETCDRSAGCTDGLPPDCIDGVACTLDSCDEDADRCVHAPCVPVADLSVHKVDVDDPVQPGAEARWVVTVTNHGPDEAGDVVVSDVLPAFTKWIGGPPECGAYEDTILCPVGALAAGESVSLELSALLLEGAPTEGGLREGDCDGTEDLCNTAGVITSADDPDPANNVDDEPMDVEAEAADLSIGKSDADVGAAIGEEVHYTIVVTNDGPDDATGVVVTDHLDTRTAFLAASADCVEAPAGTVTCLLGDIAAGESAAMELTARVLSGATVAAEVEEGSCEDADLCNRVEVAANQSDPHPVDNVDEEPTDVVASSVPVLVLTKTDTPDAVEPGGTVTYTLRYSNSGAKTVRGVVLKEWYDHDTTFVSALPTPSAGNDTWNIGDLAPEAAGTVTVTVKASPVLADCHSLSNHAELTGEAVPAAIADETTAVQVPAEDRARLAVAITARPDPSAAEGVLAFTIRVTNEGPSTSWDTVVRHTLPEGVAWRNALPAATAAVDGAIEWDLGDLAPGSSTTIVVHAEAAATDAGGEQVESCATARGNTGPGTGAGCGLAASACTAVPLYDFEKKCNILVTIRSVGIPKPGGEIVYRCMWCDPCEDAEGLVVTSDLPAGATLVSVQSPDIRSWTVRHLASDRKRVVLDAGTRPLGRAGQAFLRVRVPADAVPGTMLRAEAAIVDAAGRVNTDTDVVAAKGSPGGGGGPVVDPSASAKLSVVGSKRSVIGGVVQYSLRYSGLPEGSKLFAYVPDTVATSLVTPSPEAGSAPMMAWRNVSGTGLVRVRGRVRAGTPDEAGTILAIDASAVGPNGEEIARGGIDTIIGAPVAVGPKPPGSTDDAASRLKLALTAPSFLRAGMTATVTLRYQKMVGLESATIGVPEGVTLESAIPSPEGRSAWTVTTWRGLAPTAGMIKARVRVSESLPVGTRLVFTSSVTDTEGTLTSDSTSTVR